MRKSITTRLIEAGRDAKKHSGAVNVPVIRTSTVQFEDYRSFTDYEEGRTLPAFTYGRVGNPTAVALSEAICELEGANQTFLYPTGLSAITAALLTFTKAGDHILIGDSVYGPNRQFCDHELSRFGVEVEYYDPTQPIDGLLRDNTSLLFIETPGSQTFEMMDIPAATKAAHAKDVLVVGDNTWGAGLYMDGFALGIDICMQSVTKYMAGHSDLCMGALSAKDPAHIKTLDRAYRNMGNGPAMDDCFLALRGLRSMAHRLPIHQSSALQVAEWLQTREEVGKLYHPALPDDPGHALWKRDFTGACGLFAFEMKDQNDAKREAFVNALKHFAIGYSWGGYESLITWYKPYNLRSATKGKWAKDQTLIRLNIGLENTDDLIADLEKALEAFNAI